MRKYTTIVLLIVLLASCAADGDNFMLGPGDGAVGIAGSTSRFIIKGEYLYIATDTKLKVMRLQENGATEVSSLPSLGDLQTIFSYGDYLFLGSESGVYIYDIQDRAAPEFLSIYWHQTACDPVIVQGRFAYLTIRDGVNCRGEVANQLITLDITDVMEPIAVDTIQMISPRGLTIYQGDLYVGEGFAGLKRFDISSPYQPKLDTFYTQVPANDMIALESHLIITESNGVNQYVLESESLNLLSQIK
ncbi:MAG: hypothetical protein RIC35_17300 [Marinoscillum sp.]